MIFLELFLTFFKIGAFTFGGGYAMLPLIQAEAAERGWLSAGELVDFVAVSESTPGPFAVNISTYVGMIVGGPFGSLCATLGVVMPSFIIILVAAKFFSEFRENRIVSGCMSGLKPAVVGLIGAAVVSVGKTAFFPSGSVSNAFSDPSFYLSLSVFAVMTVLAFKKTHPIIIICSSALVGVAAGFALSMP